MSRDAKAIANALTTVLRTGRGKLPTPILLGGIGLVAVYLLAEPWLEARWGVDLPGVATPSVATTQGERPAPRQTAEPTNSPSTAGGSRENGARHEGVDAFISSDRQVYTSPAGLRYTRGSQHGHRLRHLQAHLTDQPGRPIHGVFDTGNLTDAVALVDEAYRKATAAVDTRTRRPDGRTVHTVYLRRRIGYVGGQRGARDGLPAASHLQLVLQGDRLITAYPTIP